MRRVGQATPTPFVSARVPRLARSARQLVPWLPSCRSQAVARSSTLPAGRCSVRSCNPSKGASEPDREYPDAESTTLENRATPLRNERYPGNVCYVTSFQPADHLVVEAPRQLKAFTDPLRVAVLDLLKAGPMTNQQVAAALRQPHAKVLYHVRFLLNVGLIRLVEERVKGGNVEKYYRAVARLFSLRSEAGPGTASLAATAADLARQELTALAASAGGHAPAWETRRARLPRERADEFYRRFTELVAEYWGGPTLGGAPGGRGSAPAPEEDPDQPRLCFSAFIYRDPADASAHQDAEDEGCD